MKFKSLLVVAVFLLIAFSMSSVQAGCSDPDGETFIDSKGTCTGIDSNTGIYGSYSDFCSPTGKVDEYYCWADNKCHIKAFVCPPNYICSDGTCVLACGNGIINTGEECDGGTLGSCNVCDMESAVDAEKCVCKEYCGDGTVQTPNDDGSNEVCDSNPVDCSTLDAFQSGADAVCKSDCSGFDTSSCTTPTAFSCTGTIPANAQLCPNADQNLVQDTPITLVGSCTAAKCEYICNAGYANCNNEVSDGCEVDLNTNKNNCGSCGNTCTTGQSCSNGQCSTESTCTDTDGGRIIDSKGTCVDSDGSHPDVCSTKIAVNERYCGASGCNAKIIACPSKYICSNGACAPDCIGVYGVNSKPCTENTLHAADPLSCCCSNNYYEEYNTFSNAWDCAQLDTDCGSYAGSQTCTGDEPASQALPGTICCCDGDYVTNPVTSSYNCLISQPELSCTEKVENSDSCSDGFSVNGDTCCCNSGFAHIVNTIGGNKCNQCSEVYTGSHECETGETNIGLTSCCCGAGEEYIENTFPDSGGACETIEEPSAEPEDEEIVSIDTDSDGIPDSEDEDDDNDGYADEIEIAAGTDPLDTESYPVECIDADEDKYNITGGICGAVDCDDASEFIYPENANQYCDCNDATAGTGSGTAEICKDELDNDCDGSIDSLDSDCIIVSANAGPDQIGKNAVVSGETAQLNGSGSTVTEGYTLAYEWLPPNEITLSDIHAEKPTFTAPDTSLNKSKLYNIGLLVYPSTLKIPNATDSVTIEVSDGSPVAVLEISNVEIGKTTTFNAEKSYDFGEGYIASYEWYFDDHTAKPWGKLVLKGAQVVCAQSNNIFCALKPTYMNPTNALIEGDVDIDVLGNPCVCIGEGYPAYIYPNSTAVTDLPYAVHKYSSDTACQDYGKDDKACEVSLRVTDNDAKTGSATQTLGLYTEEDACTSEEMYWYDSACHETSQEEAECEELELYWYEEECHEELAATDIPAYEEESGITISTSPQLQQQLAAAQAAEEEAGVAEEEKEYYYPKEETKEVWTATTWAIAAMILIVIIAVLLMLLYRHKQKVEAEEGLASIEEEMPEGFKPLSETSEQAAEQLRRAQMGKLAERYKVAGGTEGAVKKYIDSCRNRGFADEQIKDALLKRGWREEQVAHYFV